MTRPSWSARWPERLSSENPLWDAWQIRDNLLLLHYDPSGEDTIQKYMVKPTLFGHAGTRRVDTPPVKAKLVSETEG